MPEQGIAPDGAGLGDLAGHELTAGALGGRASGSASRGAAAGAE